MAYGSVTKAVRCGLDSTHLEQNTVTDFYEHRTENLSSIKAGNFWEAEKLYAFQKEMCSVELISPI